MNLSKLKHKNLLNAIIESIECDIALNLLECEKMVI